MTSAYCGIDPGREKFGLAICDRDELFFSAIVPTDRANEAIAALSAGNFKALEQWKQEGTASIAPGNLEKIFLGDGTGSEIFSQVLTSAEMKFETADEKMTTLEARALYWSLHPPRFPWSLVPRSLCVPPRPLDDLAAWAIVRNALAK